MGSKQRFSCEGARRWLRELRKMGCGVLTQNVEGIRTIEARKNTDRASRYQRRWSPILNSEASLNGDGGADDWLGLEALMLNRACEGRVCRWVWSCVLVLLGVGFLYCDGGAGICRWVGLMLAWQDGTGSGVAEGVKFNVQDLYGLQEGFMISFL